MAHSQMSPKYSVIMPLYNKAPYVKKALESIISQTFRDFELIIVDDGSTDESAAVCEEVITNAKCQMTNIRLIKQTNAGVAAARNRGVAESQGEFLCFLDADDWWEPNYLEEMDKLLKAYPDAGLYGCDYFYLKNGQKKIFSKDVEGYIDYCKVYATCGVMPIHPNGAIIPRKVFDEMGGFDTQIKMGEDFILFMQIVWKYKVAFLNMQLVYFNQDVDPTWRAITKLHKLEQHMLWHVADWEEKEKENASYKEMIDMLRTYSLLPYWLDERYHDAAAAELAKVDWSKQPASQIRLYKTPIWRVKLQRSIMQFGSYCKQRILRWVRCMV